MVHNSVVLELYYALVWYGLASVSVCVSMYAEVCVVVFLGVCVCVCVCVCVYGCMYVCPCVASGFCAKIQKIT